ncbi:MAG: LCP family protein [Streptomycetales bacterium]
MSPHPGEPPPDQPTPDPVAEPATGRLPGDVPNNLPRGSRTRRLLTLAAGIVALLILGTSTALWWLVNGATGRIHRIDVFSGMPHRPAKTVEESTNYLLVGSDTRQGIDPKTLRELHTGSAADAAAGQRSDTIILIHVSERRDEVLLVSFPRDSYVEIPAHTDGEGDRHDARRTKLNEAYSLGGPQLTVRTIEHITGIRVDHYIEVDFPGFVHMVNALGGVDVCTPRPLRDEQAGLDLPAGTTHLTGEEALGYVRSRHVDATGDIGRIERQQKFLAAMFDRALSTGMLLDPGKLREFVYAAAESLDTDSGLTTGDMTDLAMRLRDLTASGVSFVTMPVRDLDHRVPGVGSTVRWDDDAAGALFEAVREDRALGGSAAPGSTSGQPHPGSTRDGDPPPAEGREEGGGSPEITADTAAENACGPSPR